MTINTELYLFRINSLWLSTRYYGVPCGRNTTIAGLAVAFIGLNFRPRGSPGSAVETRTMFGWWYLLQRMQLTLLVKQAGKRTSSIAVHSWARSANTELTPKDPHRSPVGYIGCCGEYLRAAARKSRSCFDAASRIQSTFRFLDHWLLLSRFFQIALHHLRRIRARRGYVFDLAAAPTTRN